MKVTFICPKSFYRYKRTPYLSLSIAYLVSNISNVVNEVDCIDGQIFEEDDYEQAISVVSSDLICISATLLQMKEAFRVSNLIKRRLPLSKIIIGGLWASLFKPRRIILQRKIRYLYQGQRRN